MPNLLELGRILRMVQARRPSFVFSLGHSNIAADLCADIVTVATMPFGTNLAQAKSSVYVLPRRQRADDAAFLAEWQIDAEQVVETEYTFRLPERTAALSRADLGIPDDAFAVVVVGNRLDAEITVDVATALTSLVTTVPRAFVVFMGAFGEYANVCAAFPALAGRSVFIGHQRDVLAVYECCDLYVNPPRYGGGSSAAFALAMGIPVLTLAEGDVANIVGDGFIVSSFEAMNAAAAHLAADDVARGQMAVAARARFARIHDREGMLRTIVDGAATRAHRRRTA
jgi:glycosyltransferase involved in cell wall biosynthesis